MNKYPSKNYNSLGIPLVGGFTSNIPIIEPPLSWDIEEGKALEPVRIRLNNRQPYNSYTASFVNTSDSMLVVGLYGVLDIDEEDDEDDEVFISALFIGDGQAIRSNPIINLFGYREIAVRPFIMSKGEIEGDLLLTIMEDGNVLPCTEPPMAFILALDENGYAVPDIDIEVMEMEGETGHTVKTNACGFAATKKLLGGLTGFKASSLKLNEFQVIINGANLVVLSKQAKIRHGYLEGAVRYIEDNTPLFNGQVLLYKSDEHKPDYAFEVIDGVIQAHGKQIIIGLYTVEYKDSKQSIKDTAKIKIKTDEVTKIDRLLPVPQLDFTGYGYTGEEKYPNIDITLCVVKGEGYDIVTRAKSDVKGIAKFEHNIPQKYNPQYYIAATVDDKTTKSDTFKLNLIDKMPTPNIDIKPGIIDCVSTMDGAEADCKYEVYNAKNVLINTLNSKNGEVKIPLSSSTVFGQYKIKAIGSGEGNTMEKIVDAKSGDTTILRFEFKSKEGGYIKGTVKYQDTGVVDYNGKMLLYVKDSSTLAETFDIVDGNILSDGRLIKHGTYYAVYCDSAEIKTEDKTDILIGNLNTVAIDKKDILVPQLTIDSGVRENMSYIKYPNLAMNLHAADGEVIAQGKTNEESDLIFKITPLKKYGSCYVMTNVDSTEYKSATVPVKVVKGTIEAKVSIKPSTFICNTTLAGKPVSCTYSLYNPKDSEKPLMSINSSGTEVNILVATSSIAGEYKVVSKIVNDDEKEVIASVKSKETTVLKFEF